MPQSKNSFSVSGDTIYIGRDGWTSLALATYRDDYYPELTTHSWYLKDGYPANTALGGGLHTYMMRKWYGDEMVDEMLTKHFVIDHINNNHMDSRITNLEFLRHSKNVSKGNGYDKQRKYLESIISLCLQKDFSTQCYQISVIFNSPVQISGKSSYITEIKLLYKRPYPLVLGDAENILTQYEEEGKIELKYLKYCKKQIIPATILELSPEEKNSVIVNRNGDHYLLLGSDSAHMISSPLISGWSPSE